MPSPGKRLIEAIAAEKPLQVVGAINAYSAILAESAGYRAIYLSGAGVANASYGLPDLGMTSLNDVLADVRRITAASSLPLLVDVDTGWGDAFNIARTVTEMIRGGAAGIHSRTEFPYPDESICYRLQSLCHAPRRPLHAAVSAP